MILYERELNAEQLAPVMQTEGPVLVLAGAGSGKTRVLTYRVYRLVNDLNIPQEEILAITFTNKAAKEMKERLEYMGMSSPPMWIRTIHGMCNRMLRESGKLLGYTRDFTIYTESEKERVLKQIIKDFGIEEEGFLKTCRFHISSAKNEDMSPEDYYKNFEGAKDIRDVVRVFLRYEERLKTSNALDFDDLLVKAYHLLRDFDAVREYYQNKFRYVHIDEFQDTNTIQYDMVKLLTAKSRNLFAVGDDDQSIYSFRGATVENVFHFQRDFPDAKVFKLEQNYRSTKKILEAANCVIRNNHSRMDKSLYTENSEGVRLECNVARDETAEANYVVNVINSLKTYSGYSYSDFAILIRLNALSRPFEQECMKYNIPTKVFGGFKFFERKEIKDITAYLRLIVNPFDEESFLRVVNVPKRGIGEGALNALRAIAAEDGLALYDEILNMPAENRLPKAAAAKFSAFGALMRDLMMQKELLGLSEFVNYLIEHTGIGNMYEGEDEESRNKRLNIDEFLSSVIEFEKLNEGAGLSEFLAEVSLSSDTDEESGDAVTIATVHAVKGLEFKVVFICGLDETIFPVMRFEESELEEERRLMYVAITRAKERLYVTRAQSRFMYGKRQNLLPSTFLGELAPVLPALAQQKSSRNWDGDRVSAYGMGSDAMGMGRSFAKDMPDDSPNSKAFQTITSNFIKQSPAPAGGKKDVSKFKPGAKVSHPKFGEGVIVSVKNEGANVYCDIGFKGAGVKTLALEYAPLTLL